MTVKKIFICGEDCDHCPLGNVDCSDAKRRTVEIYEGKK